MNKLSDSTSQTSIKNDKKKQRTKKSKKLQNEEKSGKLNISENNDNSNCKLIKKTLKAKNRIQEQDKERKFSGKTIFPIPDFSSSDPDEKNDFKTGANLTDAQYSNNKHVLHSENKRSKIKHENKRANKLNKVIANDKRNVDVTKTINKQKKIKENVQCRVKADHINTKCQIPLINLINHSSYLRDKIDNAKQYSNNGNLYNKLSNSNISNYSFKHFSSLITSTENHQNKNSLVSKKHLNLVEKMEEPKNETKVNILDVKVLHCDKQSPPPQQQEELAGSFRDKCSFQSMAKKHLPTNSVKVDNTSTQVETMNNITILQIVDHSFLLILSPGSEKYFFGLCSMKVIYGEVFIFGANLNVHSIEYNVYSPRGSSLLSIRNKFVEYLKETIDLRNYIENLQVKNDINNFQYDANCAIILCKELNQLPISFIENYLALKLFPPINQKTSIRMDFQIDQGNWNRIHLPVEWNHIFDKMHLSNNYKIIIAGGKGVGKSTFLKYCINKLLEKVEKIRVIDLDSGQSEFTPPGCISTITINQFIIGPNYTHQQSADRMILAHINIGHNVNMYLKSVFHLLNFVKSSTPLITIVNLPGFTQGPGLNITVNTINEIEPNLIIQINSTSSSYKNYEMELNAGNVVRYLTNQSNVLRKDLGGCDVIHNLNYKIISLESMAEQSGEAWKLEARISREINIAAYLGKMMKFNYQCLASEHLPMHTINISSIVIKNSEGFTLSPLAINASLVALCYPTSNHDILICCGYGFVRGIDIRHDTLVLITPESSETLQAVKCLVLSSVTCPPSLIMDPTYSGRLNNQPYFNKSGSSNNLSSFSKRSYIPPKRFF